MKFYWVLWIALLVSCWTNYRFLAMFRAQHEALLSTNKLLGNVTTALLDMRRALQDLAYQSGKTAGGIDRLRWFFLADSPREPSHLGTSLNGAPRDVG